MNCMRRRTWLLWLWITVRSSPPCRDGPSCWRRCCVVLLNLCVQDVEWLKPAITCLRADPAQRASSPPMPIMNSNDRRPRRWAARKVVEAGASGVIVFNHGVLRAVSGGGHRTSSALGEQVTGCRPADRIYPPDPTAPCGWGGSGTQSGACCYCDLRRTAVAAVD